MSTRNRTAFVLAVALMLGAAAPVAAAGPSARNAADTAAYADRLIVTWKTAPPVRLSQPGVRAVERTARPMRTVVRARRGEAAAVAEALRSDPRVLAVVPDARLELTGWPVDGPPSDPLFADQADLAQIGVPFAWRSTLGDPSVVVAILDSGVDLEHPDLDDVAVVAPRNVVWNSGDVRDDFGHGTHVTGTVLAETDNAEGIAGIAPSSTLMPIKVTDTGGYLALSDALDGVDWAREHGADIVSMSFGGLLTPEQVALALPTFTAARDAGILMVAASGNEGTAARVYPASFPGVISVSAVDGTDAIASFSNSGRAVDIAAPGVGIKSVAPGRAYRSESGTSMAVPHVSGVAALVWAARPDLDVAELEAVLRSSAVDLGDPGPDVVFGDGRIDAAAALSQSVPDPLPNLDPPGPLPPLTISIVDPAGPVRQTGSAYTVRLDVNHDVSDSFAIRVSWPLVWGRCDHGARYEIKSLDFGPTIPLRNLRVGHCYVVAVAAVDEDGNYAEAQSPAITVVDAVVPRVIRRSPAPGATRVDRAKNIRVRFSEPVWAPGIAVRLRNTKTGLIVRTHVTWRASTNTLVLDPVLRMYPRTRYRVEVTSRVVDQGGNPVRKEAWTFVSGS